jgi:Flp pilus assembly pilin Flp
VRRRIEKVLTLDDRVADTSTFSTARRAARSRPVVSSRRGVNHMLEVFVSLQNRLATLRDEQGQTMAEYGVVLAVITLLVVGALTVLSGKISGAYDKISAII